MRSRCGEKSMKSVVGRICDLMDAGTVWIDPETGEGFRVFHQGKKPLVVPASLSGMKNAFPVGKLGFFRADFKFSTVEFIPNGNMVVSDLITISCQVANAFGRDIIIVCPHNNMGRLIRTFVVDSPVFVSWFYDEYMDVFNIMMNVGDYIMNDSFKEDLLRGIDSEMDLRACTGMFAFNIGIDDFKYVKKAIEYLDMQPLSEDERRKILNFNDMYCSYTELEEDGFVVSSVNEARLALWNRWVDKDAFVRIIKTWANGTMVGGGRGCIYRVGASDDIITDALDDLKTYRIKQRPPVKEIYRRFLEILRKVT